MDAVKEAQEWVEENSDADADEYKDRLKDVEDVVSPIFAKVGGYGGGWLGGRGCCGGEGWGAGWGAGSWPVGERDEVTCIMCACSPTQTHTLTQHTLIHHSCTRTPAALAPVRAARPQRTTTSCRQAG